MEVGAVVGAAPKSHVKREKPEAGDIIDVYKRQDTARMCWS